MRRYFFSVILLAGLVSALRGQDTNPPLLPIVSLVLPPGVASETVQIKYFLAGSFGGYGSFIRAEKNRASYDIYASVDRRPAGNIKIIAYLPGCKLIAIDLVLPGTLLERRLACEPLGSVPLRGQVFPVSITQAQPTEIEISYLALWAHRFFGIYDGLITTIRLGAVRPDDNGRFEFEVPDFHQQSDLGDAEIEFILRDPASGNIIAFLSPEEPSGTSHWLKVGASYPPLVRLIPDRP